MKHRQLLFFATVLSVFIDASAQRSIPTSVTLDTKSWRISDANKLKIPFDESFYISGSFDEKKKVSALVVKYKLKDHCAKPKDSLKSPLNCRYYYNFQNHYYFYNAKKELRLKDGYVHLDTINFDSDTKAFEILMDP